MASRGNVYLPPKLMPKSRPNPYLEQVIKMFSKITPDGVSSGQQLHEWESVGAIPAIKPKPKSNPIIGAFGHTLDILSRPLYAVAGGFEGALKEVSEGTRNPFEIQGGINRGLYEGITGRDKGTFSENIQQGTDAAYGVDINDPAYDPTKGVHKVNPILKFGGGLALDIALDPTTYVGIGLIKHGVDAAKVTKFAAEATELIGSVDKAIAALKSTDEVVVAAKGVHKIKTSVKTVISPEIDQALGLDVVQLNKSITAAEKAAKLNSPEFQKLMDIAGESAAQAARKTAEIEAAEQVTGKFLSEEMALLKVKFGNRHVFKNAVAGAERRAIVAENRFIKKAGDEVTEAAALAKKEEVAEFTARVLETSKEARVGLKFAGKSIASMKIPEAAKFIEQARHGEGALAYSVKVFDKVFKNGTGAVGKEVNEFTRLRIGQAESRIRAHQAELHRKYGSQAGVTATDRAAAWRLLRTGGNVGVGDVGQLSDVGKTMNQDLTELLSKISQFTHREINRWMPREMKFIKEPKSDEWIDSWRNWTHKDGAEVLWAMRNALEQAASIHATNHAFAAGFGTHISSANKGVGTVLSKMGYRPITTEFMQGPKVSRVVPKGLEDTLFHPEVAEQFENIMNIIGKPMTHNQLLDLNDKVVSIWKRAVTVYNPSYHIRNAQTDTILNMMAGVTSPKSYSRALNIMRRYDKTFAQEVLRGERAWEDLGPSVGRFKTNFKDIKGGWLSEDRFWTAYHQMGLAQSFTRAEFADTAKMGLAANINSKIGHASEVRENYFRLAHFVDKVLKSKAKTFNDAITEVAAEVRKYHFDFSDFTYTERNVLSRVIPFYKWSRKALPLMIEQTFTNPGKVMIPTKGAKAFSQMMGFETENNLLPSVDEAIPDWLKEGGAVPVGHHGDNTVYVDQRGFNPWSDAIQFLSNPSNALLGGLTPTARIPIELKTGTSLFTGNRRPPVGAYALSQFPVTNMAGRTLRSNDEIGGGNLFTNPAFLNWLTGTGLRENTKSMRESAK